MTVSKTWAPGPAAWRDDLAPLPRAEWSYDRAAHLLAHAGFFIDPLYSTGLALSTAMVDQTAEILMQCFKTNDFSMPQFERMNQFFANNITYAAFGDLMNYWQFFPTGQDG